MTAVRNKTFSKRKVTNLPKNSILFFYPPPFNQIRSNGINDFIQGLIQLRGIK